MSLAATTTHPSTGSRVLLAVTAGWFVAVVIAGATVAETGGPFLVALSMAAPLILWSLAYATLPGVRQAVDALSLRLLVLVHTGRIFGALFLVYSGHGLHPGWAVPAAWADIAVAVLAIPVALLAIPAETPVRWRWAMAWNVFAVLDIVAAPGSGLVNALLVDPESMAAMASLPLYAIPAFFVPTMILTNILITVRLLRDRPRRVDRLRAA